MIPDIGTRISLFSPVLPLSLLGLFPPLVPIFLSLIYLLDWIILLGHPLLFFGNGAPPRDSTRRILSSREDNLYLLPDLRDAC